MKLKDEFLFRHSNLYGDILQMTRLHNINVTPMYGINLFA